MLLLPRLPKEMAHSGSPTLTYVQYITITLTYTTNIVTTTWLVSNKSRKKTRIVITTSAATATVATPVVATTY